MLVLRAVGVSETIPTFFSFGLGYFWAFASAN
jgi:hypothetical protein